MGCFDHNEEYIGSCMWCGKQVCRKCVGRASGKKLYCSKCASSLGDAGMHDARIETAKGAIEMSEIANGAIPSASAQGKPAISEHAQKHAPCFSTGSVFDKPVERAAPQPLRQAAVQIKTQVKPDVKAVPTIAQLHEAKLRKQQEQTPQPAQKPAVASAYSSSAGNAAAKSALGMFAQQAMEQLEAEKKKKLSK